MKAIKLLTTFILILGGVIGAFYLILKQSPKPLPPIPDTTYQTYRKQFIDEWEQVGDWDERLFLSHRDLVQQLSKKYETATLNDLNTKTATEIVYKKIFDEWKSSSCAKNVIEKYNTAITFIESKDNNAKTDPNVQKIKNVYSTYSSAYDLAHQGIGLNPHFDGSNWKSYPDYSSSMNNKMNTMLRNSNYQEYLSNIVDIKNGLNAIPNKLTKGRSHFYEVLSVQIREYYSQTEASERTRSELNRLRDAISKYENEYASNSTLSEFAKEYANDVYKNENNNNNNE